MRIWWPRPEPEPDYEDETPLMRAAARQVTRLTRASRLQWVVITLTVVSCALLLGTDVRLYTLIRDVNAAAIRNCQAANAYRAGDELGWQAFAHLIVAYSPHPAAAQATMQPFLNYIHHLDAPRDCTRPGA